MTSTQQIAQSPAEGDRTWTMPFRKKVAYGVLLAGLIPLAATGIGTFALGKAPMTHWVLMAHVSAAPIFAVGLALMALIWADRSRFGSGSSRRRGSTKTLFWLILASGLVVILTGVVPMTPLFGTPGQHALYLTHRYSAIVLAVAVSLHLLSLRRRR